VEHEPIQFKSPWRNMLNGKILIGTSVCVTGFVGWNIFKYHYNKAWNVSKWFIKPNALPPKTYDKSKRNYSTYQNPKWSVQQNSYKFNNLRNTRKFFRFIRR